MLVAPKMYRDHGMSFLLNEDTVFTFLLFYVLDLVTFIMGTNLRLLFILRNLD